MPRPLPIINLRSSQPALRYTTSLNRAGLYVFLRNGTNLLATAREVIEKSRSLPNKRIVLDIRNWTSSQRSSEQLRFDLQGLANETNITIDIRKTSGSVLESFIPALTREEQAAAGPMAAMPGMEMCMVLRQRLELRQEIRLELRLVMNMELNFLADRESEEFYDDLPVPDKVPQQLIEVYGLLAKVPLVTDRIEYLKEMDGIMDRISVLPNHYFRMTAMCRFAEELANHSLFTQHAKSIFTRDFTKLFNATFVNEQPSLSLLVAESQAQLPGTSSKIINGLVRRAIAIAEANNIEFRGKEARNLEQILKLWPTSVERARLARDLADRFVAREEWVPRLEEKVEKELRSSPEEETRSAEQQSAETEAEISPSPEVVVIEREERSLSNEEKGYVNSRLIQHAMDLHMRDAGINEETFLIFMRLATNDAWEETAATAFRLLSRDDASRQQLQGSLDNFSSPYYRAKAAWALARAQGEGVAEARQRVVRALEEDRSLTDLQRDHERFSLNHDRAPDPLEAIAPRSIPGETTSFRNSRHIESWARDRAESQTRTVEVARTPVRAPEPVMEIEEKESVSEIAENEAREAGLRERRGQLYLIIGRSLIKNNARDAASQIEALKLVAGSGSARALALLMEELPFEIAPEVHTYAQEMIKEKLEDSPYYRSLAKLLLIRRKDIKNSWALGAEINKFISTASEDEDISNLVAIKDICNLARNLASFPPGQQRLLTLARKRAKLFAEKMEETDPEKLEDQEEESQDLEAVEENDIDENSSRSYPIWKRLHQEAQAHILASSSFDPESKKREPVLLKKIERLEYPIHRTTAYRLRAYLMFHSKWAVPYGTWQDQRFSHMQEYMAKAIHELGEINRPGAQTHLAMEIEQDLAAVPDFSPSEARTQASLLAAIAHPLVKAEIALEQSRRQRVGQAEWYTAQNMSGLIAKAPEIMGRLLTSKQLGKTLQKKNGSAGTIVDLLTGHLKNGPYQRAMDEVSGLIEAEEAKPGSAVLERLYSLFITLLRRGDQKAKKYLEQRKQAFFQEFDSRLSPEPLTVVQNRWIKLLIQLRQGHSLVSLVYSKGLAMADRIELLETLAHAQVMDQTTVDLLHHFQQKGKPHLFFDVIQTLKETMPGVRISRQLIDNILKHPEAQKDEANIQAVIADWAGQWNNFEAHSTAGERLHILAANDMISQMYFHQESRRYDFGKQRLTYEQFVGIVKKLDSSDHTYDHRPLTQFEAALERAYPTTGIEREDCLGRVEEHENLNVRDRESLSQFIAKDSPLSEADILEIREISKRAAFDHVEDLLPFNQQIIYNLYFGEAPVDPAVQHGSRRFLKYITPQKGDRNQRPFDLPIQFRLAYQDSVKLFYTDWSIRELRKVLEEHNFAEKAEIQQELQRVLEGNDNLENFATNISRLHARVIASISNLTLPQARGSIKKARNEHFNKVVLPVLIAESSHILETDHRMGSAFGRRSISEMTFHSFTPRLTQFIELKAEASSKKQEIASRLELDPSWTRNAGNKALVEMELLAETAGLDPLLRDRFYLHILEAMQNQADQQKEINEEMFDLSQRKSVGRLAIRLVPKRDIYASIRIGDFRPCCISTDGEFFSRAVHGFFQDKMTLSFAITDPETRKAVGHMIGHLGLTGASLETAYFLNGLYLRHQYRGEAQENSCLDTLADFADQAGVQVLRHGTGPYHDLTKKPPKGFTTIIAPTIRLQTVHRQDGTPLELYNDLNFPGARINESVETKHYHRRVDKT